MSTTVEDEGFAAHRKRVLIGNLRASQLRRLAVHRREHGIPIDWEAFGFAIAKALRPGELSRKRPPPTAEDALLGGMKHPIGAFIGAIVFVLLQNFAIDLVDRERFNLVIGSVFLIIVLFSPDGLLGAWAKLRSRLQRPASNPRRQPQ